ncbi:hypothetical protein [Streptomyces sp. NBC_00019]|uniref:hypothetical protein n=1 Tax=Streptomyces sp. NBC_00019 TaxID=2975623 RepID=UPI00324CA1EA
MALHSFDHGSSIGVQPDTSGSPYIWLACDYRSLTPGTDPNSHTICRIKYQDGGVLDYHTSAGITEFKVGLSDFLDCPRLSIDLLDMNQTGGQYNQKFPTNAGNSLPGREPQGMAIWRTSSGPRLTFGFSSKIAVDPDEFQAPVFYKSDLAG